MFEVVLISVILFVLSGCAMVGPSSISRGRADYNEALDKTENEQLLMAVVKGRYGETFSFLSVIGVAANVRFASKAGIQVGFGPSVNYAEHLIPFAGGVAYEENPTITYAPLQGKEYLEQVMCPIPLEILVPFVQSGLYPKASLIAIAEQVNDLKNPDFLPSSGDAGPDLRFQRFAELNEELIRARVVRWVNNHSKTVPFAILISGWHDDSKVLLQEYLGLLGFKMPKDLTKPMVLPISSGHQEQKTVGVAISTRATVNLIQILRASVEVPSEHLGRGWAIQFPKPGLAGQGLRVRSSVDRPDNALVSVKYSGYWFFIDRSDTVTKRFYLMLRTLWGATISSSADTKGSPVLTLPVAR